MVATPPLANDGFDDTFPDHTINDLVSYGDPACIYRAQRKKDGTFVILKVLRHTHSNHEAPALFKHEYEVTRQLNAPGVIGVFSFERHPTQCIIEFEDFEAHSLDTISRQRRMTLEEILVMAIQVADALGEIHKSHIIHKDINPSNIVFNPITHVAKIIDFGISTYFTREQASITSPQMFEGSLPYISPEQTGRMNRSMDYRTDFYSLGATLYTLLVRRPLFIVNDPMEWFHCHIAKQPVPPDQADVSIPSALSAIVMKLLAKTAEDRYQSTQGIKADLLQCLGDIQSTGSVKPFPLGRHDRSDRFQIPQRIYGRDKEVHQLLSAFDQVGRGNSKMTLVSGYAGIGKTRLIREIYKPVTEKKGYFVSGKFDQLNRNIPYYAMSAALRDLIRQLLTEPDEKLAAWRDRILHALGHNGHLIIDIIRELELIIGPQPEVPDVPPLEAEQRFHLVFQHFVQAFSTAEQPLVLFLDDLQWADRASMDLIDLLTATESGVSYLLLIGAYRDNALSENHPVAHWLDNLRLKNIAYDDIHLGQLTEAHLTELLADTLLVDLPAAAPLADLIKQKTGGNPFFTEEFLKSLYHEGLINYSTEINSWSWDMDRIRGQQYTDNVVDLMTFKLKRLPPETLQMIELGACIGFVFSLKDLALVSEKSPAEVALCLRPVINDGLVSLMGNANALFELDHNPQMTNVTVEFTFAHDRVHQAAYALLSEDSRNRVHLSIGRLLLTHLSLEQQREKRFEIAYHLNMAAELINDPDERFMLCRLNLDAGKTAKRSNAYQPAFIYFSQAIALLSPHAWKNQYDFTMELYTEAAEAAYLTVDYNTMDKLLDICSEQAKNLMDRVKPNMVKISACMATGQLMEAINIGKQIIKQLGQRYPANPKTYHIVIELIKIKWLIRNKPMEDWRSLPIMTDPRAQSIMKIGAQIGGAAMFAQPKFLPLLVCIGFRLSLTYGHAPETLMGYAAMGMVFSDIFGDVERGEAFGRLAIDMVDQLQAKSIEGRIRHVYNAMVRHWKEPVGNIIAPLNKAFFLNLEHGDFEYAAHSAAVHAGVIFDSGVNLQDVYMAVMDNYTVLKPLKQGPRNHYLENMLQTTENLLGHADDPSILTGRFYDIEPMIKMHENYGDKGLLFIDYKSGALLAYLFGKHKKALDYVNIIRRKHSDALQGMYFIVANLFMDTLVRLSNADTAGFFARRWLMFQVTVNLFKFKRWAKTNPSNTLNKLRLIQAERLRVMGKVFEAHALYEESSRLAREQGFIHEEAMAMELCGAMHMNDDRTTLGLPHLEKARDLYRSWGAQAKVDELHSRFPQLISHVEQKETTDSIAMSQMDMGSLMKALKTIAQETVHSRMIEIIIAKAMEFAGAQKGFLILRNLEGVLYIEAEASVDGGDPRILQSIPVTEGHLCQSVVNYVSRTKTSIVIHDARQFCKQIPGLEKDDYIVRQNVLSLLCLPILTESSDGQELMGILYLENNRATGAFTQQRFDTLGIICLSAAGRLELSRKAAVDGLTGLFNHDHFQNILSQEFISARRHSHPLSLILLDIDHFKVFNDTWGHQAGDLVLKDVARVLKNSCRIEDIVARYGGEEMVVVLPMATLYEAKMVAERIRNQVENHHVPHEGQHLKVTVSLGISTLDSTTNSKETLIRLADKALYRSKASGRNRLTVA
ncbi:MAG: diguanylate cyclase [Proteobacteria bacterium]|nr:diguanylate cyclase [Pseudomonadota bacterium]